MFSLERSLTATFKYFERDIYKCGKMDIIEISLYVLLGVTLAWYILKLMIINDNQMKITRNQIKIIDAIKKLEEKLK
jgi:hypothetical protein